MHRRTCKSSQPCRSTREKMRRATPGSVGAMTACAGAEFRSCVMLRRSTKISREDWKRSAGFLRMHFRTAWSNSAGSVELCREGGGAVVASAFAMVAAIVAPRNGWTPVAIS
jgi:hypothetical protein